MFTHNLRRDRDQPRILHRSGKSGGAPRRVVVAGAGPAGALTTSALLQRCALRGYLAEILLIDPAGTTGSGTAFATSDPRHLLNVTAGNMSAHPDDPGDFVRWLSRKYARQVAYDDYVPRAEFGEYMAEYVERSTSQFGDLVSLRRVWDTVDSVELAGSTLAVRLRSGTEVAADCVVLAIGAFRPGHEWLPHGFGSSAGSSAERSAIVHDPWKSGALECIPDNRDVLLVGTGLTAVDAALSLSRPGRVVHATSRRGLLPRPHVGVTVPFSSPPAPRTPGLEGMRAEVFRHLARSVRETGDWRPAFDSLRPITAEWWGRLSGTERRRFLTDYRRVWETHRHRMAPEVWGTVSAMRESGHFRLHKGEITRIAEIADGVRVELSGGEVLTAGAVVNCTGPQRDVRRVDDPLVAQLLRARLARPGPCGLGLDTTEQGLVLPAGRQPQSPLWTIGAPRLGTLLETTAIPEIRQQAVDVAESVCAWVRHGGRG